MASLGKNIKMLRTSRGLTQPQLADIVGASSYTTISKWESDSNSPRGKELVSLCNYFNVSSDDLLGITNGLSFQQHSKYNYLPTSISAGLPFNVDGMTNGDIEKISLPDTVMGKWAGNKEIFITKINGDSMNKVTPDGSLIAVKPITIEEMKDGDMIVFSMNGEYSVKFYQERPDELAFRPFSYDKRFLDLRYHFDEGVQIHGKVVVYMAEMD